MAINNGNGRMSKEELQRALKAIEDAERGPAIQMFKELKAECDSRGVSLKAVCGQMLAHFKKVGKGKNI